MHKLRFAHPNIGSSLSSRAIRINTQIEIEAEREREDVERKRKHIQFNRNDEYLKLRIGTHNLTQRHLSTTLYLHILRTSKLAKRICSNNTKPNTYFTIIWSPKEVHSHINKNRGYAVVILYNTNSTSAISAHQPTSMNQLASAAVHPPWKPAVTQICFWVVLYVYARKPVTGISSGRIRPIRRLSTVSDDHIVEICDLQYVFW